MSYLLEALQKSQHERDRQLPDLHTTSVSIDVPDEAPRSPWFWIAIVTLVINTVVIFYLLLKSDPAFKSSDNEATPIVTVPVVTSSSSVAPTPTPVRVSDRIVVSEVDDKTPVMPVTPRANSVAAQNPVADANLVTSSFGAAQVAVAPSSAMVPEVYALPLELRNQLPALEMNSHIYAPNQADSFVMINNSSLTPGEKLTADLVLIAVTPEGAVLQFQEQRFLLPALKRFTP